MRHTVRTSVGGLSGRHQDGVFSFLGVPYGQTTSGGNRFMPPVPVEPWTGVRSALEFGPPCHPTVTESDRELLVSNPIWREYGTAGDSMPPSEDCLSLNIWTSDLTEDAKMPVLVWLHGGGFSWGSGASPLTRGDRFALRHSVVVITVNHRLGVLGYLHLPDSEESGVAGVLDLVLALEWVRSNVHFFGGDPDNVTIAGHSGGGAKVACLMAMPRAAGLFKQAVIQSGVVSLRSIGIDEAVTTTKAVLNDLDVNSGSIEDLQGLPVSRLTQVGARYRFRPVVNGASLPVHPFDPEAAETAGPIPLMIGTTKHDTATFKFDADPRFGSLTADDLRSYLASDPAYELGDGAGAVIARYSEGHPEDSIEQVLVGISTAKLRQRTDLLAQRKLRGGSAPVFMYSFEYESEMPSGSIFRGMRLAPHGWELPFVFDLVDRVSILDGQPDDFELARLMSSCWAAFVRGGDPGSGPELPDWPEYSLESRPTMVFDTGSRVVSNPFAAERACLEEVVGARA